MTWGLTGVFRADEVPRSAKSPSTILVPRISLGDLVLTLVGTSSPSLAALASLPDSPAANRASHGESGIQDSRRAKHDSRKRRGRLGAERDEGASGPRWVEAKWPSTILGTRIVLRHLARGPCPHACVVARHACDVGVDARAQRIHRVGT